MKLSELVNFKGTVRYAVTVTHPDQKPDPKKVSPFAEAMHIRAVYAEQCPSSEVEVRMVVNGLPV